MLRLVTKKVCILFGKSVPKVKAVMLRLFAWNERKTSKLQPNEAVVIVIVDNHLRIDDGSSNTAWIHRKNQHNFICRSFLSKML
jgi:hypothetical protein